MRKLILISTFFFILALFYLQLNNKTAICDIAQFRNYSQIQVRIKDEQFYLYEAESDLQKQNGLSNTTQLEPQCGMIFYFDEPDYHSFWMKDMNYSIDIIYLDQNNEVVDIISNADPSSFPNSFKPQEKSRKVIEINGGESKKIGLKLGDKIGLN